MYDFKNIIKNSGVNNPPILEPADYIVSKALYGAVKAALATDQPLLLTGEPGTGKTKLAAKLAYDLNLTDPTFDKEIKIFNTKTTSIAQDLFYSYDALRHFNVVSIAKAKDEEVPDAKPFLHLEALGEAIAMTSNQPLAKELLKNNGKMQNSVVLIDEIDKAPLDFSNDILDEIENMRFEIKEIQENRVIKRGENHRIAIIVTSNSEKNLPPAFLRRCAYFHIPFPTPELLYKIVKIHFNSKFEFAQKAAIEFFLIIRDMVTQKKPATAELICWLHILEIDGFFKKYKNFDQLDNEQKDILLSSLSVLVKTKEDLITLNDFINNK